MTKRYTKRQREQAAHWCALMASSNCELMEQIINGVGEHAILFTDACGEELLSSDTAEMAREAFVCAVDGQRRGMTLDQVLATPIDSRAAWAEADAALRTGWEPR